MKVLIIGGARHGEWVEGLPDGIRMWVDIANASRHVIRKAHSNITDLESGKVKEAYVLHLAVHPDLTGPQEPALVGKLLNDLTMNAFARAHGEPQEISKESEIHVPDTP